MLEKLKQAANTAAEADELIRMMFEELKIQRRIIELYYLEYGGALKDDVVNVPDSLNYDVILDTYGRLKVLRTETKNITVGSRYETMLCIIERLRK